MRQDWWTLSFKLSFSKIKLHRECFFIFHSWICSNFPKGLPFWQPSRRPLHSKEFCGTCELGAIFLISQFSFTVAFLIFVLSIPFLDLTSKAAMLVHFEKECEREREYQEMSGGDVFLPFFHFALCVQTMLNTCTFSTADEPAWDPERAV